MNGLRFILLVLALHTQASAQSPAPAYDQHLAAAARAQAQQDCHTAALEYGRAADLRPRSGELRSNQGIALYCDGQLPESVAALRKALSLAPDLVAPHLFLGLATYLLSDMSTAAKELERFVTMQPSDPIGHLWLGYTYVSQQQYEAAIKQFERVTGLDPGNVDAQYALGQSYLEVGRRRAKELALWAPNGALSLKLAGEQYEMSGDTVRAASAFQASAEKAAKQPEAPGAAIDKEKTLYLQAHDAEAKAQEAFQAVLRGAPDSYRAHQISADVLVAHEQQEAALAEYREVLRRNPTLPGVHEAISRCLMQGGHFAEALSELEAEQRLQPRSAHVLTERARVELAMGDDTSGAASLREALKLPEPPAGGLPLMGRRCSHRVMRRGPFRCFSTFSSCARILRGVTTLSPVPTGLWAIRPAMAQALATTNARSEDAQGTLPDRAAHTRLRRDRRVAAEVRLHAHSA